MLDGNQADAQPHGDQQQNYYEYFCFHIKPKMPALRGLRKPAYRVDFDGATEPHPSLIPRETSGVPSPASIVPQPKAGSRWLGQVSVVVVLWLEPTRRRFFRTGSVRY